MKTLKPLSFFGSILVLLISCEDNGSNLLESADLLAGTTESGRSYAITSAEVNITDANGILILDECITDNTIIYYPTGRYEENEGRSKCNVDDPPGSIGTWILTNQDTQVLITINGVTESWDIVSISNQGHQLTRTTNDGEVTFILERIH